MIRAITRADSSSSSSLVIIVDAFNAAFVRSVRPSVDHRIIDPVAQGSIKLRISDAELNDSTIET